MHHLSLSTERKKLFAALLVLLDLCTSDFEHSLEGTVFKQEREADLEAQLRVTLEAAARVNKDLEYTTVLDCKCVCVCVWRSSFVGEGRGLLVYVLWI